MINQKTVNSVNTIVGALGNAASMTITYASGAIVKNLLCKPKVQITDFIISAAILSLDFKLCIHINDVVNELKEENEEFIEENDELIEENNEYIKQL